MPRSSRPPVLSTDTVSPWAVQGPRTGLRVFRLPFGLLPACPRQDRPAVDDEGSPTMNARDSGWVGYGIAVLGLHLLGGAAVLAAARAQPALLGLGFLAYILGLRHAFDADHIATIDNTVRKLVQQRQDPLGVGFYFSLGHSTVVFLMALAMALVTRWARHGLPHLKTVGALVGTTVSGGFLVLIGLINLVVWIEIYWMFQRMRRGEHDAQALEHLLLSRGLVARFAGPLFRMIDRSWQVYPVGVLFGLGFDTASEIALLALA